MKKLLRKTGEAPDQDVDDAVDNSGAGDGEGAVQELPAKGTLTDAKDKPLPKVKKDKAPPKPKVAQTAMPNGLTYALISRVRNAYPKEKRAELEAGKEVLKMVDGKGVEHEISSCYVVVAEQLGVDYLKSVRTSAVKKKLGLAAPKKEKAPKAPKAPKEKKVKTHVKEEEPAEEEAPTDPEVEDQIEEDVEAD